MNQNEDTNFIQSNNTTSINIDYSDYSSNKLSSYNPLPLWAKKGLKINCLNDESSTTNLVHNRSNTISSSTPISTNSNRTRINLYNGRSTDSDERNSADDGQQNEQFESPVDRFKKRTQKLSTSNLNTDNNSIKLNGGGDHNDEMSSLNKKKNPLYVSTENLKYSDNFFAKTPLSKQTNSSIQLITSGTLNNKPSPGQKPSVLINSSTPKLTNNQLNTNISLNSNNSLNNSLNSTGPTKSISSTTTNTMNRPQAMSKRREELAKALNEARAKLQNLTDINRKSTGGLSTSMSVANINRLSLNLSSHQKDNNSLLTPSIQKSNNLSTVDQAQQAYENDAVRRSISLSDLSHSQMLANRSLTLKQQQQIRSKLSPALNNVYYPLRNFKKGDQQQQQQQQQHNQHQNPQQQFDSPQTGLWDNQQQQNNYHNERSNLNSSQNSINQLHNGSSTTTHKPIRVRMSRSSSMASINKNDSLARTNLDCNKSQGLWNSPSSLSINTLRSNSSAQNSFNKFNHHPKLSSSHLQRKINKGSSDDESSSDENDSFHRMGISHHQRPSTPPKPTIRQLRRSSTTSNNLFLPTNNAHNNSANLANLTALHQQPNNSSNSIKSAYKTLSSSSNRKSWGNNFELRPAKSEYNLNSMGQETVNSPSSGFWSNQSNSGNQHNHQNNGTMTNGNMKQNKQNNIGYENDLTNINPATVPLTVELFQHIVDELNHLGTFAKKIHYRAQAEDNEKLCNLLKEGVSKAYVNLATIVPLSNNNVLPITKSLNNSNKDSNSSFNHHLHNLTNLSNNLNNGHHQDSSNTDHDTEEDNLSSPLNNNNATVGHVSLTSDSASSSLPPQETMAFNLLQHYSAALLSMVEGQIRNKDK